MLNQLALPFLVLGGCTALMILKDIFRHPHPVGIMNIIWPLTGLYMPFIGWLAWWYLGRKPSRQLKLALLVPQKFIIMRAGRPYLFRLPFPLRPASLAN